MSESPSQTEALAEIGRLYLETARLFEAHKAAVEALAAAEARLAAQQAATPEGGK